ESGWTFHQEMGLKSPSRESGRTFHREMSLKSPSRESGRTIHREMGLKSPSKVKRLSNLSTGLTMSFSLSN
ncbi:hypothetical protein V7127_09880, partial [Bacillus sp. JJ1773]|uniref:hypothetical protein n=1 Tax=Bacillus sp. JJ1773 TaxID=3122965 RepID=UPI003000E90F